MLTRATKSAVLLLVLLLVTTALLPMNRENALAQAKDFKEQLARGEIKFFNPGTQSLVTESLRDYEEVRNSLKNAHAMKALGSFHNAALTQLSKELRAAGIEKHTRISVQHHFARAARRAAPRGQ